jgi:phosphatidate cytidylyltransferase
VTEVSTKKKSDLGVRTASAVVMIAIAGAAICGGGWYFDAFVLVLAILIFNEWRSLTAVISPSLFGNAIWNSIGVIYIGLATATLILLGRMETDGGLVELVPIALVAATDVGAYFLGRTIGGPKIAPQISPSKTWAGLLGGMMGAAAMMFLIVNFEDGANQPTADKLFASVLAMSVAIVAQLGDFFQSWMKRKAGVKDSGRLIPGHGGVFDRADGLVAVLFVLGIVMAGAIIYLGSDLSI